jgi:hypothetical protein
MCDTELQETKRTYIGRTGGFLRGFKDKEMNCSIWHCPNGCDADALLEHLRTTTITDKTTRAFEPPDEDLTVGHQEQRQERTRQRLELEERQREAQQATRGKRRRT